MASERHVRRIFASRAPFSPVPARDGSLLFGEGRRGINSRGQSSSMICRDEAVACVWQDEESLPLPSLDLHLPDRVAYSFPESQDHMRRIDDEIWKSIHGSRYRGKFEESHCMNLRLSRKNSNLYKIALGFLY